MSLLSRIFGRGRPVPAPARRNAATYDDATTATWTYPHRAVGSSNIASVAYDVPARLLEIRFHEASRNHSNVYRYAEVPIDVFAGLMNAASKGRFHWDHIRGRYTYADVG